MDTRPIVPPGSTALESAVDTTFPRGWDAIAACAEPLATARDEHLLPWVAEQWQITQFAPYFPSTSELLAQAVPWLMERGSAASVRRALGWIGYSGVTLDEAGAWLHIDVGRALAPADIAAIVHVVSASLPAHVRFWRIYHGYDARPIVLDRGPQLDAGMLDGYSGVMGASGVVESFGIRAGATLPALQAGKPAAAATQVRVGLSRYDDMPVLDVWRLDSRVLAGVSGGVMELASTTSNAPQPGGGVRVRISSVAQASPWAAPAPASARTVDRMGAAAPAVHPPRSWGGPWGGPWRQHFQLIAKEEP